jgi:cell envelope opacity-associated protein A
MEEIQKDRQAMKPIKKKAFDESHLTPRQRKAYQIAKSQGTKSFESFDEILMDVEPEVMQHLRDTIMNTQAEERKTPPKNPLSND